MRFFFSEREQNTYPVEIDDICMAGICITHIWSCFPCIIKHLICIHTLYYTVLYYYTILYYTTIIIPVPMELSCFWKGFLPLFLLRPQQLENVSSITNNHSNPAFTCRPKSTILKWNHQSIRPPSAQTCPSKYMGSYIILTSTSYDDEASTIITNSSPFPTLLLCFYLSWSLSLQLHYKEASVCLPLWVPPQLRLFLNQDFSFYYFFICFLCLLKRNQEK